MAQLDSIVDLADFSKGYWSGVDTTKAPFGSFRVMRNAQITDRGGIAPRPGTELLGKKNTSSSPITGFYSYKRSFEENELLIKAYDDELEFYSKNNPTLGWNRLKDAFTVGKEFGFVHSLFNTGNENYLIGSNQYQPFFSWTGATTTLTTTLVGAEAALTVASTLIADVYEQATATANTTTVLTVATANWAANQWNGFYVLITAGAQAGQVRLITATSATTITFTALGGAPGNVAFEIRRLLFPVTGTLIYNGTQITYTNIPTSTTITVASAHAATTGTIVTPAIVSYNQNPRGNRFTNYLGRIIVGNVRSALARDSGGTLQGYASGGSYFVSKVNTPLDFTYTATRVAGEGDIQSVPYGGGNINDVLAQEDATYVFKRDYIESISYTQDVNDLAKRDPIKTGIGSVGKVTQGTNDVYFFTEGKQLTSLGRVKQKDLKPQSLNIGNKISRWLNVSDPSTVGRGLQVDSKVYFPLKSASTATSNDTLLVYNEDTNSFEGIWDIGAFGLTELNGSYYYGESSGANVYKMFTTRLADVEGTEAYGYTFEAKTHFFNLTPSKAYQQSVHGLVVEGYIRNNTEGIFTLYSDFNEDASVTFTLASSDAGILDGADSNVYFGDVPLGINAYTIDSSDVDNDGRRHFTARVYFPYQYGNYFSVGIKTSGVDQDLEVTRFGVMLSEETGIKTSNIKSI